MHAHNDASISLQTEIHVKFLTKFCALTKKEIMLKNNYVLRASQMFCNSLVTWGIASDDFTEVAEAINDAELWDAEFTQ